MASAPTMLRYVSCCPAKEAVAPSSSTAEERTAAIKSGRLWQFIRSEMAAVISSRKSSGCASSITVTGREKPSGTRWYMRARRLRLAALPPTRAVSKDLGSPSHRRFILLLQPFNPILQGEFAVHCIVQRTIVPCGLKRIKPSVEAGRDGHEQVPRGRLERIADRMGDVLRQVCDTPCLNNHGLISKPDFQRALQNIADFVFAAMHVEPISALGFEHRLEEIIRAASLITRQFVRDG